MAFTPSPVLCSPNVYRHTRSRYNISHCRLGASSGATGSKASGRLNPLLQRVHSPCSDERRASPLSASPLAPDAAVSHLLVPLNRFQKTILAFPFAPWLSFWCVCVLRCSFPLHFKTLDLALGAGWLDVGVGSGRLEAQVISVTYSL